MNTKILIIICCLVQPLFLSVAEAGCIRGNVTCDFNTAGTEKTCKATLECKNAPGSDFWAVADQGGDNVINCIPFYQALPGATVKFSLTAIANPTSIATTKVCQWLWYTYLSYTTAMAMGFVEIDDADGLPVELMEFSVEQSDE